MEAPWTTILDSRCPRSCLATNKSHLVSEIRELYSVILKSKIQIYDLHLPKIFSH
jgi:hypothetical protein